MNTDDVRPESDLVSDGDGDRRPWAWPWWVAGLLAALGYAWLRSVYTHEYSAVPWRRLLALNAPLPFGHRVLVPWLVGPWVERGIPVRHLFAAVEALSYAAVVWLTVASTRRWLSTTRARWAGVLVGAVLPLVYVAPRHWPLHYPWDGPALVVLAAAVWASGRHRYWIAWVVATIGALNRETAILVPLIVVAVGIEDRQQRPIALAWAQLIVGSVIVVRVAVAVLLPDNPGPPLHWTIGAGEYRVFSNLRWLANVRHWPSLVVYLGVLPLAWPVVRRAVPTSLRRVAMVGVAYFVGAMLVANVYEPRAWGESVLLVSIGAAVGLLRPRRDLTSSTADVPRWLRQLDRFAVPALLLGFAAFVLALTRWSFLPVAQWPPPP